MPAVRLALPLAVFLLLPGCAFLGGEARGPEPDRSEYDGGVGFAIALHNLAEDPFEVTVRVLGVGNAELARLEERVEPGDVVEKWWSLDSRSRYSARMNYTWTSETGSASHGLDEQVFDANECPDVTRLEWELRQSGSTVGHAFLGRTCVTAE